MKFGEQAAAAPAHPDQVLQLERAAIRDVGADVPGVGEHSMDDCTNSFADTLYLRQQLRGLGSGHKASE